jgi:hypothetical protein
VPWKRDDGFQKRTKKEQETLEGNDFLCPVTRKSVGVETGRHDTGRLSFGEKLVSKNKVFSIQITRKQKSSICRSI